MAQVSSTGGIVTPIFQKNISKETLAEIRSFLHHSEILGNPKASTCSSSNKAMAVRLANLSNASPRIHHRDSNHSQSSLCNN